MEHAVNNQHLHPIFRDILNSFVPSADTLRLQRRTPGAYEARIKELAPELGMPRAMARADMEARESPRYYSTAYATCSLCGDAGHADGACFTGKL